MSQAGTLKLSQLRRIARLASRNAGDTTYYPTFMLDTAIQRAADTLIRDCHLCQRTDTTATVAATDTYATPTGFRCDRLDAAWLSGSNVVVQQGQLSPRYAQYGRNRPEYAGSPPRSASLALIPYVDLNDMAIALADSGQPQYLAFASDGSMRLFPNPDQVYTVNLRWADFFTSFAAGVPLTSFTNTAGVVSAVVVIDASDNQGTSLTASFTDTGSGSGATATATLATGVLSSVAVGGTPINYSSGTKLLLGGNDSADTVTNLPDDLMREVLMLGAPAFLQFNDPEKAYATAKGQEFRALIKQLQGNVGGLGVQRVIRASR